jgi:hypothetical protein
VDRRCPRPHGGGEAVHARARVAQGPGRRDDAAAVEDAGAERRHLALVGGGRRHRLLRRLRPVDRPGRRRVPAPDRPGADDAALGLRPLAVPRAVQDPAGESRRCPRVPFAEDPARRDRAGLAVLAARRVGLARVRQEPLPRSRHVDRGSARRARAPDDLGVGQVLPDHGEREGDARDRMAVRAAARRGAEGLARVPLHLLRRVQPRGARRLLDPDRRGAVLEGRGRLVDGRHRAGHRAADADASAPARADAPDGDRHRRSSTARRSTKGSGPPRRASVSSSSRARATRASSATRRPHGRATSRPRGRRSRRRSRRDSASRSPACRTGPRTAAGSPCRRAGRPTR